jgi:quercetin dioxygenase-like cupin family protein
MARAGDELLSPISGRLVFRRTAADTNGDLVEVDVFYKPDGNPPPVHYHPTQEERFEVVSGEMLTHVDGVERTYGAGETFVLPPGSRHSMHNAGSEEAHVIWQTRPALKTEALFETMWGLMRDGKTNKKGVPNLLHAAVLMREYQDEFRLTQPPFAVQKVLFGLLAPIGGLLGYRGRYPEYSGSK